MKKKSNKWIAILVALFAIFTSVVISFGYFIANVTINGSIYDVTGTADSRLADITLTNLTPNVSIVNGHPMTQKEAEEHITPYTFTITNNSSTRGAEIQIVLETKSGTNTIPDRLIDAKISSKSGPLTSVYATTITTETGYQSAYVLWSGSLDTNTSKTFNLLLWIDENGGNNGGTNDVQNKSWYGKIVVKGIDTEIPPMGTDLSNANTPKLVDNLIPVIYDETTSKWKMVEAEQGQWYNYEDLKWANAVTVKEAKRGTYAVGDPIEMSDILGMWVWIPRYEYKYTNLGNQYAGGSSVSLPGGISIKFVSGTSVKETTNYIIHPAFRNGSVNYTNNAYTTTTPYQMGGWDSEITGFWMGKFETSSLASATGTSSVVLSDPIVKPNVVARRYQIVSHQYATMQNVKTYHGISELDSHMSKDSEWGAVAYLSQSDYGKYGNTSYSGANKEIYINNSSGFYTGRSMGAPANTSGSYTSLGTYEYNVALNGTGASTTGTIYGIYDMSGGSWEYQMGWLNTASSNFGYRNDSGTDTNSAGFRSAPSNHRYYEEYTTTAVASACGGIACYGQALSETAGWYGDYQNMVSNSSPWFLRGAYCNYSASASGGGFTFSSGNGTAGSLPGMRAVLI